MTQTENGASPVASVEEIQHGWHALTLRVAQLEAEKDALEQENKALRFLLERVIDHRQKSHGELVLLLTGLISKLPINDVGVIVSKLVEHNTHVNQVLAALVKGTAETDLPQPMVLRALEQTKRDLETDGGGTDPAGDSLGNGNAPVVARTAGIVFLAAGRKGQSLLGQGARPPGKNYEGIRRGSAGLFPGCNHRSETEPASQAGGDRTGVQAGF
jgi:hypothetical protein